ncbi:hypothetical protein [Parachitinimonas caeni]|uniref:N-acetylglutamate synthase n=1 Tax=Parachitinimonas caeni TaxID=3031301 RepID=A0ABT7E156_9NEIS|nr:hypothetical protein [Parachitinimonas caeni]MDK2126052.1 hypothetical protein [Parachitinimonas caeni]
MKFSLDGKTFRSVANSDNGEVSPATYFTFRQQGNIVSADYSGGKIVTGHLLAVMTENGELNMRYHHLNQEGAFMLGQCHSTPVLLPDGRLKYLENWQWLSGDMSSGYSEMEEVPQTA